VALGEKQHAEAHELYERSLAIWQELADQRGIARAVLDLGRVACRQGNAATARARYAESTGLFQRLGDKAGIAACLEGVAEVETAMERPGRAVRLCGAARALREATGALLPLHGAAECERQMAALQERLGDDAFAAAWAEGRAMSLEEAVRLALEEQNSPL
jgi:hypothetical protein